MTTVSQIRAAVRAQARDAGSVSELARQTGIDRAQLSCFLTGKRPISDAMLKRLGWKRVTTFQRIR